MSKLPFRAEQSASLGVQVHQAVCLKACEIAACIVLPFAVSAGLQHSHMTSVHGSIDTVADKIVDAAELPQLHHLSQATALARKAGTFALTQ